MRRLPNPETGSQKKDLLSQSLSCFQALRDCSAIVVCFRALGGTDFLLRREREHDTGRYWGAVSVRVSGGTCLVVSEGFGSERGELSALF